MRVTNLTSPRTGAKVANQFTIEGDGGEYFQSYDSLIGHLTTGEDGVLVVGEDYNYSNTTSRYFKQWLKSWGLTDSEFIALKIWLKDHKVGDIAKTFYIGRFEYTVVYTDDVARVVKNGIDNA